MLGDRDGEGEEGILCARVCRPWSRRRGDFTAHEAQDRMQRERGGESPHPRDRSQVRELGIRTRRRVGSGEVDLRFFGDESELSQVEGGVERGGFDLVSQLGGEAPSLVQRWERLLDRIDEWEGRILRGRVVRR